MKVCLAQINTTPGDFDGNLRAIKRGIDVGSAGDADLVVFPELTIPGYLSQDLIYQPKFIDRNLEVLQDIVDYSAGLSANLHIVVGCIELNEGVGKPYFNVAIVIAAGQIVGRYIKQLLPFYDVFDELRYFEAGNELLVLEIAGSKVGFTICEDLWNDKGSDDYSYADNPMEMYRKAGVATIVSLNSSPFVEGKPINRLNMIAPGSEPDMTVVYVNQRGGQDELVFDGQSFVVRNGDLLHLSEELFEDTFDLVDIMQVKPIESKVYKPEHYERLKHRSPKLKDLLVLCLRDYVVKSGFSKLVLASSGGVDSAVVCKLACEAVGAENVHAIRMPSKFSSLHSREDAIKLHENLGCWDYEMEIDHEPTVQLLNERYRSTAKMLPTDGSENAKLTTGGYNFIADENIQARMRDLYVMHFSNAFGAMPLSTGNKTESACGYYTHFDMNFSFAPIKDLYKYQVVDIAKTYSDIPENIWQKPPSAELAHGQTDEASLLPYAILDPIVRAYVEDYVSTYPEFSIWLKNQLIGKAKVSMDADVLRRWSEQATQAQKDFERIVGLIGRMEYKRRQTCPGTKVSKVAFGIGRRIPIVEKWS
ncbi:MAG: NAD(+) synthase [Pseudomonadales bacterium]